jgi:hypothetical protein
MKTLNGDILPWRLRPRAIPLPEESPVMVQLMKSCKSTISTDIWNSYLRGHRTITLSSMSTHILELNADVHSTAFIQWSFRAASKSQLRLKVIYSEGYELEPRNYPFFRTKGNRLDGEKGQIIGPFDDVTLDLPGNFQPVVYEPFWFRTFRLIHLELTIGPEPVELVSFEARQVNYPLAVLSSWNEPGDEYSEKIWDISIRTLRNCMFDGYSDCPFYEQLQ